MDRSFNDHRAKRASPIEQAFQQLISKEKYLVNFDKIQESRGSDQARFIFYHDGRIYDAWFNTKDKKLSDLSWVKSDEFPGIMELAYAQGTIERYLKPFADIPGEVLDEAPKIGERVSQIIAALDDPANWFHLKKTYKATTKHYLSKEKDKGFFTISVDSKKNITNLQPRSTSKATIEATETIRDFPDETIEQADANVVTMVSKTWNIVEQAMQQMDAGKILVDIMEDYYQRYYIKNGSFYYYIFADGGELDSVSERKRDAVLEELLEKVTKGEEIQFATNMNATLKKQIFLQTDATNYFEHLKQGKLHIGGGPTTDMQWVIRCESGAFIRSQGDGHGGASTQVLPDDQVKTILENKRYGWVKFDVHPDP